MFSSLFALFVAHLPALVAGGSGALMLHGTGAAVVAVTKVVSKVRASVAHFRAVSAAMLKAAEAARVAAEAPAPAPEAPKAA